ncbi:uncharacterized protein LOC142632937 [Castanea sativa]|uniref:uncharacterized protein LOC142632937 n=1 Tax=Castanea sativa TaxID=21020 RepID=UPI003F649792
MTSSILDEVETGREVYTPPILAGVNHERKLRHKRRRRTQSISDSSSGENENEEGSYRPRSRTPPSESYSYEESSPHNCKNRISSNRGLGTDGMSRALNQISKSPFTCKIEGGKLHRRSIQPTFTIYNGRTDPVEHVSHFNQRMVMHSKNEALMCKVFPSSLEPVTMRWYDGLGSGSISSFKELTWAFGSRFITCSRVPRPLDSLLSMAIGEGETLKTYTDRYSDMFNEIDGDFDDVAIRTFKVSLLAEHGLRKSLTGKPVSSVRQLMEWIDKYKRVEEDQPLSKRKVKVVSQDRRDFKSDKYNDNCPRPNGQTDHTGFSVQENISSRPPLGTINVIFAVLGRIGSCPSRVMTMARPLPKNSNHEPKRVKVALQLALSFSENDKFGTIQPHDDALVVTLKIGGMT